MYSNLQVNKCENNLFSLVTAFTKGGTETQKKTSTEWG